MGAWIEIKESGQIKKGEKVAPFMGAWIEIDIVTRVGPLGQVSHPSWVRGLKSKNENVYCLERDVAPFMGAWIEIYLIPPLFQR